MRLSSLFKTSENSSSSSSSPWPWPILPTCRNPRTLSFRAQNNNHNILKTLNSTYQLDDETSYSLEFLSESQRSLSTTTTATIVADDLELSNNVEYIESVVKGLKSEKERLFFEPKETSLIILEETKNKGRLSSAHNFPRSRSMTAMADDDDDEGDLVPFKESVVMSLDSKDPFVDFRESMEEMVEAHGIQDWESLEELLSCYLKVNCKTNHGYIVGAFVDLLVSLAFNQNSNDNNSTNPTSSTTSTTKTTITSTSHSPSFTSPLSFCNSSSTISTSTSASLCNLLEGHDEDGVIHKTSDITSVSSF